jgi:hypothetical protein
MTVQWQASTPIIKQTPVYSDRSIEYRVNSQGFRDNDFPWVNPNGNEPYRLAIGCSHTWGIGLQENETWVSHFKLIMRKLKTHYPQIYNLGMPGCSNDKIYRILYNIFLYKKLKPHSVIVQLTYPERTEWFHKDDNNSVKIQDWQAVACAVPAYYKVTTDHYHIQKTIELMTAIKTLCDMHGTKCMFWCVQNYFGFSLKDLALEYNFNLCTTTMSRVGNDLARDNAHFGPISHLEMYKRLYDYAFECNILKRD